MAAPALASLVSLVLRHVGFTAEVVPTVAAAGPHLRVQPLLLLLDTSIPRAMTLLAGRLETRPATIAIVDNEVGGTSFDAFARGADQVVRLPFTPDELAVRAAILLRRLGHRVTLERTEPFDGLELSLDEEVHVGSRTIGLTPELNSLLYVLAANAPRVVTNAQLRRLVWGMDRHGDQRVLTASLSRLTRALGRRSTKHFTVETSHRGASLRPVAVRKDQQNS